MEHDVNVPLLFNRIRTKHAEIKKLAKCKDLSSFEKRLIVMARRLGCAISKTSDLVGVPGTQ